MQFVTEILLLIIVFNCIDEKKKYHKNIKSDVRCKYIHNKIIRTFWTELNVLLSLIKKTHSNRMNINCVYICRIVLKGLIIMRNLLIRTKQDYKE